MILLYRVRADRDINNECPKDFNITIQKCALESISVIALNTRLGLLSGGVNAPDGNKISVLIRNLLENAYQLEIMPSLWRYFATPTFNRQMNLLNELTEYTYLKKKQNKFQ